jgi:hypothetical protein
MTEDRMPPIKPLQKSVDSDCLRTVAEEVLHILIEADVEGLIGAGRRELSAEQLKLPQRLPFPDNDCVARHAAHQPSPIQSYAAPLAAIKVVPPEIEPHG